MGGILSKGESVLRATLDKAIDETVKQLSNKGTTEDGEPIEFRPEDLQQLSKINDIVEYVSYLFKLKLPKKFMDPLMDVLLREYVLFSQQRIKQPSVFDTSHNYRTWTLFTEFNNYARTLGEVDNQYTLKVSPEDQEKIKKDYESLYSRLKEKDDDSEQVKAEKKLLMDQIPHTVKVSEALFKRPEGKDYPRDRKTNFFLPCFGQWFVEQAFKTGPYEDAHIGIESMLPDEFKKQWGNNRIDLSNVYGSNVTITNALRLKKDGKLKTQKVKVGNIDCDFPPKLVFDVEDLKDLKDDEVRQEDVKMFLSNLSKKEASERLYALGHPRFNLHFGLVFIQTLWIREHNDVCEMLKKNNPKWDDERLFQTARLICIAELSKVVVEDYIKHLMNYSFSLKFKPEVTWDSAFQYTEHANVEFNFLYRWHSLVPSKITLGKEEKDYKDLLFKPKWTQERGFNGIAEDLTKASAARLGLDNTPEFLQYLETTTLLHSRVLKLKTYNEYRKHFGLKEKTSFDEITKEKILSKKLEGLYRNTNDIDWYVGILAENHLGDGLMGELMQTMIGNYAFSAIFSSPICSKLIWNETTFTKEGMERINETRLYKLINRNSQETEFKPIVNPDDLDDFDCFSSRTKEYKAAIGLDTFEKITRDHRIQQSKLQWEIVQNTKPWHIKADIKENFSWKFLFNTLIQHHTLSMAKRQLSTIFGLLFDSLKTHSFLSTIETQKNIISSILYGTNSKSLTNEESHSLMTTVDSIVNHVPENEDLIDNTFGEISRLFSHFQCEHLKNFVWNRDVVFGELFLNGLDPTQLRRFTEDDLKNEKWKEFLHTCDEYLQKTRKIRLVDAIKHSDIYYVDNFETMDLVTSNHKIARPRALFYWDKDKETREISNVKGMLYPIGIQLNDKTKSIVKVKILSGENIEHVFLGNRTYVEVSCGKQKKSTHTAWFKNKPEWNESFEFNCDHEDKLLFVVYDNEIFKGVEVGRFKIDISHLDEKVSQKDCTIGKNGHIKLEIEHHHSTGNLEKGVYTPEHSNWTIAKLFVGNAFVIHHEIVSHNLKCHSLMEAVAICMHHTLYEKHPVFAILSPHLYYTETINVLARGALLKADGTGLVSQLFSCGIDGNEINNYFWDKFDYSKYMFPNALKERDIKIGDRFYYEKDGKKMWGAIHNYVSKVLNYYYNSKDISQDEELKEFIKMLQNAINGMIKVEKLDDLIELITSFIFNSTSNHTSLHFSQLNQLSFAPLLPTYMSDTPPPFTDKSFGHVDADGVLTGKQQKMLMQYLPSLGQAMMINATFAPVTKEPKDTPLILIAKDDYNMFKKECQKAFNEFQSEIKEISKSILGDDSRKLFSGTYKVGVHQYDYMANNSRSINL